MISQIEKLSFEIDFCLGFSWLPIPNNAFSFRFIASPFCLYIGIKDGTSKIEKNSICEQVFTTVTKAPDALRVSGLAKQLGWSEQRVDRWFKKRRKAMQVSMLKKATECCWRCVFYFWLFSFGAVTLLRTDWFYDSNKWMEGYIREVCIIIIFLLLYFFSFELVLSW